MRQNQTRPDRFSGEFNDFGSYLKYLRRRAGLGQRELGLAVGYGEAQISRLEHNHRLPELSILHALFIPALGLEDQPEMAKRLLELARHSHSKEDQEEVRSDAMGVLEEVPGSTGGEILRTSELNSLLALFEKHNAVLLYGFPGVGKSVLAAALIRTIYGTQPVFWHTVNNNDPTPFETFIRQLSLFLVTQGQTDAALFTQPIVFSLETELPAMARYIQVISPFICVDEFHHMKSPALFADLVEKSRCRFLLVSRERLEIKNVEGFPLTGMNESESRSLLRMLGLSIQGDNLKDLHALTQGNPMLLRLAGTKILQNPSQIEKFIKQLSTQKEITAFLMSHAMEGLTIPGLNLLYLISIFRQPVNLLDADLSDRLKTEGLVPDLTDAITTLQQRHLLDDPSEARLHPILHNHLSATLRTRADIFHRFHLLAAKYIQADILEALYHFTQSNEVKETLQHIQNNILNLDSTGQGETAADLVASLLNRIRNTPLLSKETEAQFLAVRGQLLMSGRRTGEAEADLRQALELAMQSGASPEAHHSILLKLARFLLQRGKIPEADQLCDEAENIPASNPNPGMLAEILAVRCTVRLTQTRFDEAAEFANQALKLVEPLAHRDIRLAAGVRSMAHNTLGVLSHIQRDIPSALFHWRNAEEAALLAGNLRTAFRIRGNIGALLFDQGDLNEARQTYEGIVEAVQAIGDVFTLGKILNALGAIYHLQARPAEALEILDHARQLKQLIGDVQGEATTDNQRAQVLLTNGRAREGLPIMERLLKQTEGTGEMRWRASYLDTMGMILLALGNFHPACERLEEAGSLPGAASDPQLKTYLRNHLALAYLGKGDFEKAQEVFHNNEGILDTGMVAVESLLVDALLMAATGKLDEALKKLFAVEKEAENRALSLYSRMAFHVHKSLESGGSIPGCISLALGAQGFPE